jgi:CHAT domain-containing protein/tetratricopeptide (TPR) repeat protein
MSDQHAKTERPTSASRVLLANEGNDLYSRGLFQDAAKVLSDAMGSYAEDERQSTEFGTVVMNLASAYAELGELSAARQLFHFALGIFEGNDDYLSAATVHFNLGNVYNYGNSIAPMHDHYIKSLDLFRKYGSRSNVATCLLSLVHFLLPFGKGELAKEYLSELDTLKEVIQADPVAMWSYAYLLGKRSAIDGDLSQALAHFEEAERLSSETSDETYRLDAKRALSEVFRSLGRTNEALTTLLEVRQMETRLPNRDQLETVKQLGEVFTELGRLDEAYGMYDEALAAIDRKRVQQDAGAKYHAMEDQAHVCKRYTNALFRTGQYDRAFGISEKGQSRITLDLMFRHQIRRQAGRQINIGPAGRVFLEPPDISEARTTAREENLHILKLYHGGDAVLLGWFLKPDGSVSCWDASQALPVVGTYDEELFSWMPKSSPSDNAGTSSVTEVRSSAPVKSEFWAAIRELCGSLYDALLPAPIREYLERTTGQLLIVPDGRLSTLPFSALGPSGRPLCSVGWQITTVPSFGVYLQLDRRRDPDPTRRPSGALVVGNCGPQRLAIPLIRGSDKLKLIDFCDLPGTALEAKRVAHILGCEPMAESDAQAERVLAKFETSSIMHFATHGYWHSINGQMSFLLMSPTQGNAGVLLAGEISEWVTPAELVVLSACQTGLGSAHPDSYVGLTQSFLIAGARAVLVSLWPIGDATTVRFMEIFYTTLRSGHSAAEALRLTQEVFRQGNSTRLEWAGFQLVGRAFYEDVFASGSSTEPFGGPMFCGGDMIVMDGQSGRLPLEDLGALTQTPDEGILLRGGEICRLPKVRRN